MEERPIIGITMGDPAGNGPEITVKALSHEDLYQRCRPIVVGDAGGIRKQGQCDCDQRAADAGETAISPEETLAWMGECLMQAAQEDAPESVELELDCSSDDEGTWSADDSVAAAVAGALLG